MEQATSWTKEELKEFERLVDGVSSRDQVARISARLDMKKATNVQNYSVSLIFSADRGVAVKAASPEEAAEHAYNSDEAFAAVCHQCARRINVGDCIRVIVYDEAGNEVFDDGAELRQIAALQAEIAELKAKLAVLGAA